MTHHQNLNSNPFSPCTLLSLAQDHAKEVVQVAQDFNQSNKLVLGNILKVTLNFTAELTTLLTG